MGINPTSLFSEGMEKLRLNRMARVAKNTTKQAIVEETTAISSFESDTGNFDYLAPKNPSEDVVLVNPHIIRQSQSNVRASLPDIVDYMKRNGWGKLPSVDLVRMPDGGLTSIDNTRIAAAALTNTPVKAVIRGFDEVFPLARKPRAFKNHETGTFPSTWGEAVLNRIGSPKQDAGWRMRYPNGSQFTGIHETTLGFSP